MANKGTTGPWQQDGALFRKKADEGKLVVVEVMTGSAGSVEGAASWKSSYPSGDKVFVVADGVADNKMTAATQDISQGGSPFVFIIDKNFKWKLPQSGDYQDQMWSVHQFVDAL